MTKISQKKIQQQTVTPQKANTQEPKKCQKE